MDFIVIVIFIIVVVVRQLAAKNTEAKGGSSSAAASQPTRAASRTARAAQTAARYTTSNNAGSFTRSYTKAGSANVTRDGRVYASIDFDNTHYHAEGFDFDCCISFKGLPPGTDELAVLIASNNRHERELAKLLQERQS